MRDKANHLGLSEIEPGQIFEIHRRFSSEDVLAFARLSGDHSPLHVDKAYAARTEFGEQVVHGMLLASLFSQLVGMRIPGEPALYLGQDLSFRRPVTIGEKLRATAKVTGKNLATRTITLATEIRNEDGKVVVSGSAKVKVRGVEETPAISSPSFEPTRGGDRRAVLVTGGSRGIGAGIARLLASRGFAVAINYFKDSARAESLVRGIRATGGTAVAVRADVRMREAVSVMIDEVVASQGRLDCIVNGAVGELNSRPFIELDWDAFQQQLDYQLKAVMNVCQLAHPHLRSGIGPAVVNIVSQAATAVPPAQMADYVAAKYALRGLSKALAVEWASDGIRVNTVSPGLVQTELTQHYHDRVFKMESARTPLKRLSTVNDVAETVAFLLSSSSAFVTGVDMSLTGGQVMS